MDCGCRGRRTTTRNVQFWVIYPKLKPETNMFFINTTWRDIKLHRSLSPHEETHPNAELPRYLSNRPQLNASHMDLVHYCKLQTVPYIDPDIVYLSHHEYLCQSIIPHIYH
ncbi:hypothetical protein CJF30_00010011 [Rutstroemia sp. NJR-2017a BBW]|nr:hypothetical protein CJF30_00010011 [Rutstroemia sp. NJR-2017a BBW]